jgi:hypothetical protein
MIIMPVTRPPSSRSLTEEDQAGTMTKMTDRVRGRERCGEGTEAQVTAPSMYKQPPAQQSYLPCPGSACALPPLPQAEEELSDVIILGR